MATKRKSSAPPPRSPSPSSSNEDPSSEEEEQAVAQPTPSLAKTPNQRTQPDGEKSHPDSDSDSESESESESESDPEPPKANLKPESSSDEEEEEEKEEEKPKSAAKDGSKPEMKKRKVSGPDQTPSEKSSRAFPRIWSQKDEMVLLVALCEYRASKGQLPPAKDFASFLPTISGSISFPVTEKQLGNKIHQMKRSYEKKIRKGSDTILNPHDKAVFKLRSKLFGGGSSSKVYKKKKNEEVKHAMGSAADGGMADIGAARDDGMARSNFYLRGLIEDLIKEERLGWLCTIEAVIAQVGESRANELEAKTKMLRIDAMKLCAREERLKAELVGTLADQMADD